MEDLEELQDTDTVVPDDLIIETKTTTGKTGYPFDLSEEQIIRIIYFFGSRKLQAKAAKHSSQTSKFTATEQVALKHIFDWFNFAPANNEDEFKKCYNSVCLKFKGVLSFLRNHPAFVTKPLYDACNIAGYKNFMKPIIWVKTDTGEIRPRAVAPEQSKSSLAPIGQIDSMLWNIQSVAMDKMQMILMAITPKDINSANLGMKSKALRDIFAMYHMSRLQNKNPNMTLINLQVNTASPHEKMTTYSNYLTKNRDSSSSR